MPRIALDLLFGGNVLRGTPPRESPEDTVPGEDSAQHQHEPRHQRERGARAEAGHELGTPALGRRLLRSGQRGKHGTKRGIEGLTRISHRGCCRSAASSRPGEIEKILCRVRFEGCSNNLRKSTYRPAPAANRERRVKSPERHRDCETGQTEVKTTTCYMCACRCGIRVHLRDREVRYIEGNPEHPLNQGGIRCRR